MVEAYNPKHVIIVGGTSGIGLALAKYYINNNYQLTVIGSNAEKIAKLPESLINNELFKVLQCNLCDHEATQRLLFTLTQSPFNILIYCAGKYYNERVQKLDQQESQQMLRVNLQAFEQIFSWASEQLKQRADTEDKHLVAIASVAGLLDFKDASLYAKCKRQMMMCCDTYRLALKPFAINVTCIAPGYINTAKLRALNHGDASHKPYIISEEQAVVEIVYAIKNNIALHIFPKAMKRTMGILSALPRPILNKVMRLQYRFQDKKIKQPK